MREQLWNVNKLFKLGDIATLDSIRVFFKEEKS